MCYGVLDSLKVVHRHGRTQFIEPSSRIVAVGPHSQEGKPRFESQSAKLDNPFVRFGVPGQDQAGDGV